MKIADQNISTGILRQNILEKAEFEDLLSVKYAGSLDFITFDENIFDKLFKNFIESEWWEMTAGCEEKLEEFLTFAIGLNNINKG